MGKNTEAISREPIFTYIAYGGKRLHVYTLENLPQIQRQFWESYSPRNRQKVDQQREAIRIRQSKKRQ